MAKTIHRWKTSFVIHESTNPTFRKLSSGQLVMRSCAFDNPYIRLLRITSPQPTNHIEFDICSTARYSGKSLHKSLNNFNHSVRRLANESKSVNYTLVSVTSVNYHGDHRQGVVAGGKRKGKHVTTISHGLIIFV
jgi:hypothetical protein